MKTRRWILIALVVLALMVFLIPAASAISTVSSAEASISAGHDAMLVAQAQCPRRPVDGRCPTSKPRWPGTPA
jgi:uncharacterized membrane protein